MNLSEEQSSYVVSLRPGWAAVFTDGMDAPLVTVEVHLAGGLPAFNLVGLPETEVKESRERVRAGGNCSGRGGVRRTIDGSRSVGGANAGACSQCGDA